jgi:hypothetical protein
MEDVSKKAQKSQHILYNYALQKLTYTNIDMCSHGRLLKMA